MTRSITDQAHDFYDAVPYEVPTPDTSLYALLDTAARLDPPAAYGMKRLYRTFA